jgi:AAA15 family ATPase/GTPase
LDDDVHFWRVMVILLIAIREEERIKFQFLWCKVLFRWEEAIQTLCFGVNVDIDSSIVCIVSTYTTETNQ